MKITLVTGNKGKKEIAEAIFAKYGVELDSADIETPEIQSLDVKEVAEYSALFAAKKLNTTVMVSDAGYFIEALNGFPGALVKFVNDTLNADDLLNLMQGKDNRAMSVKECLCVASPDKVIYSVVSVYSAKIEKQKSGDGSAFDQVMILDGETKTHGSYTWQEQMDYFKSKLSHYDDAAKFMASLGEAKCTR